MRIFAILKNRKVMRGLSHCHACVFFFFFLLNEPDQCGRITRNIWYTRSGKVHAKISTDTSGTLVYVQSQTTWCLPLWNMHNHSLLIVFAFSFLLSRAITCLRKWHLMVSISQAKLKLCSYRITGARCTIWHVSRKSTRRLHCSKFSLDTATFTKAVVPLAQTRRIILRDTPVSMGIR